MNYNPSKQLNYLINIKLTQKIFEKTNLVITRSILQKEIICKKFIKTSIRKFSLFSDCNLIFPLYIFICEKNIDSSIKSIFLIKLNQFIFTKFKKVFSKFKFVFILYCFQYLTNINLNE